MNDLYLVYNPQWNDLYWYEKYDRFVVSVSRKDDIKSLLLKTYETLNGWGQDQNEWEITHIGVSKTTKDEVILGSFNAA